MFSIHPQFARRRALLGLCLTSLMGWHLPAHAALTMSTTRVIYDGERRSVSLLVANPSKNAFAVQAWVNTPQDDTVSVVPFVTSPALFRLDPAKQQQVQINGLPNDLPGDRESLFYFNVQEIPQLDPEQKNVLAVALRTRIKVFYRPPTLQGGPSQLHDMLGWSLVENGGKRRLAVDNPTPYHVTFGVLNVLDKGAVHKLDGGQMLAPLGRHYYDLPAAVSASAQLEFNTINDYGANSKTLTVPVAMGN